MRRGVRDRHRSLRDAVGDRDDVRVRDRHELSRGRPDRVWCIVYGDLGLQDPHREQLQ